MFGIAAQCVENCPVGVEDLLALAVWPTPPLPLSFWLVLGRVTVVPPRRAKARLGAIALS